MMYDARSSTFNDRIETLVTGVPPPEPHIFPVDAVVVDERSIDAALMLLGSRGVAVIPAFQTLLSVLECGYCLEVCDIGRCFVHALADDVTIRIESQKLIREVFRRYPFKAEMLLDEGMEFVYNLLGVEFTRETTKLLDTIFRVSPKVLEALDSRIINEWAQKTAGLDLSLELSDNIYRRLQLLGEKGFESPVLSEACGVVTFHLCVRIMDMEPRVLKETLRVIMNYLRDRLDERWVLVFMDTAFVDLVGRYAQDHFGLSTLVILTQITSCGIESVIRLVLDRGVERFIERHYGNMTVQSHRRWAVEMLRNCYLVVPHRQEAFLTSNLAEIVLAKLEYSDFDLKKAVVKLCSCMTQGMNQFTVLFFRFNVGQVYEDILEGCVSDKLSKWVFESVLNMMQCAMRTNNEDHVIALHEWINKCEETIDAVRDDTEDEHLLKTIEKLTRFSHCAF